MSRKLLAVVFMGVSLTYLGVTLLSESRVTTEPSRVLTDLDAAVAQAIARAEPTRHRMADGREKASD